MEAKLNLTAGTRGKDDDNLDPEMDKLFGDFMQKIQADPQAKGAFQEMDKMFKNVFNP